MRPARYLLIFSAALCSAVAADQGNLRVGAARVDITPTVEASHGLKNVGGTTYEGIHDHIYVRAIVIDDGRTSAALISIDTSSTPDNLDVRQRIEKETGVPAGQIMISATHAHNSPAPGSPASSREAGPQTASFTATVNNAFVEAVRQAKARLQPGRMVLAAGHADVNVNRDEFAGDHWTTGRNFTRPSDKTEWVLRFDNAAGEPVAFFVNYGVHPLVSGIRNPLITGDLAGATERFIESYYQDKVVALWTEGPAGDQNPIAWAWDLRNAGNPKPLEPGETGFQLADAVGRILGEEAIRAAADSRNVSSAASLWSMSKDVICPGSRYDARTGGRVDIDPQTVHMDLLMINNIALAGVAAEVVTNIYYHLKQASPLTNTILVSLTNGRHTYMPDDAAYDAPIFEVKATSIKRGCGENAIVDSFVDMIGQRLSGVTSPASSK